MRQASHSNLVTLEDHPYIKRVTPQRKVFRTLKYTPCESSMLASRTLYGFTVFIVVICDGHLYFLRMLISYDLNTLVCLDQGNFSQHFGLWLVAVLKCHIFSFSLFHEQHCLFHNY